MAVNNPKFVLLHCSDVSYKLQPDQLDAINVYHRDVRGFPISSLYYFVGYHRLINNGQNIQCRADGDEGSHCNQKVNGLSMNFQSLGICVAGDFDIEPMKDSDYTLLQKQVWEWQDQYQIPNENVKFHRDYATNKTCPGSLLDKAWLQGLLKRPQSIPSASCTEKDAEINKLKQLLAWYDTILNQLFRKR